MNSVKRSPKLNASARIDVGTLLPRTTKTDDTIKRNLSGARRSVDQLRKALDRLSATLEDLESQDRLGNFEIQDLMSQFNQAETLASNVSKKRDDTANAVIGKI